MQSTCSDCKNKKSRFTKKRTRCKSHQKKNLTVNLLELILVEYIRLLVILIKNKIKKIKLQLANLSVQNNDDNNNNNNNNNNNKIEKYCLIFYRYTL